MSRQQSIVWLASSDADITRARKVLQALTPQGVLDELGFLVLLGALSDRMYPAVNTIMTRARYLVFVPAIYRHIERQRRLRKLNATTVARELQFQLRNALCDTNMNAQGIIGRDAGRSVVRPPSNVYWTALAQLGIATRQISEAAYLEQLSETRGSGDRIIDDDGAAHLADESSLWDATFAVHRFLSNDGNFLAGTSFELSPAEAHQLRRRYDSIRPDGGTSLMSHMLEVGAVKRKAIEEARLPWELPGMGGELTRIVEHSRRLSLLARGTTLQYQALLFEKRKEEDPGTRSAFSAWWQQASDDLAGWDLQDFALLPCVCRSRRVGDLEFLSSWRKSITEAKSAGAAYASVTARGILEHRERHMRGVKARLRSRHHLKAWAAPTEKAYADSRLYELSYRHHTARQFALDISDGIRKVGR